MTASTRSFKLRQRLLRLGQDHLHVGERREVDFGVADGGG